MPSIKTLTPILGGSYYHIFNRGSNRQIIFYTPANYIYFLKLLNKFLGSYVHFLSYSLLPNHFHLVIKVNEEIFIESLGNRSFEKENGSFATVRNDAETKKENGSLQVIKDETEVGKL